MTPGKKLTQAALTFLVMLSLAFGLATYAAAAWRTDNASDVNAAAIDGGGGVFGGGAHGVR